MSRQEKTAGEALYCGILILFKHLGMGGHKLSKGKAITLGLRLPIGGLVFRFFFGCIFRLVSEGIGLTCDQ